jgi:2-polyprenyl-6-methoxyphenol hydroxylase-like FAD-dependent oxidoreductase
VEEELAGELVVDASGRGSRTPQWLETLGFGRVKESHVRMDVAYASRTYQRPPGFASDWKCCYLLPRVPAQRRLGVIIPVEGDRWQVSLAGWLRDHSPDDDDGFLEFARGLPQPHLYEAIRQAEPLGPVLLHRVPSNQRRRYERLKRFPEGLVVMGDALCSFNPVYGQGMSVAAIESEVLDECLREGLAGVSQRYRKRAAAAVDVPWAMATGEDFRFPEIEGRRPPGSGALAWYLDRVQQLAPRDMEVLTTFVHVMHLLKPPTALLAPRIAWKVLTAQLPERDPALNAPRIPALPERQVA